MQTTLTLAVACILAALVSMFPNDTPTYAWWGVLAVFLAVPVVGWLEHSASTFFKDFDEITNHTHHN